MCAWDVAAFARASWMEPGGAGWDPWDPLRISAGGLQKRKELLRIWNLKGPYRTHEAKANSRSRAEISGETVTRLGSDVFMSASSEAANFELDFQPTPGGNPLALEGTRRDPKADRDPLARHSRAESRAAAPSGLGYSVMDRLAVRWDCEALELQA